MKNEHYNSWIQLFFYIAFGYVILLLFFFLYGFLFFPFNSFFDWSNLERFNTKAFWNTFTPSLLIYSAYAIFVAISFALRKLVIFQKLRKFCVRSMWDFMTWLLPCTAIVLFYRCMSVVSPYDSPFYEVFKASSDTEYWMWVTWGIYCSSVVAGLLLLFLLVLIYITALFVRSRRKKACSENESSEQIPEAEVENVQSKSCLTRFCIPSKEGALVQFLYWYSILVLWGVFAILTILLYMVPSMGSGNGWGGIFLANAERTTAALVSFVLGYFVFGIIVRWLLAKSICVARQFFIYLRG